MKPGKPAPSWPKCDNCGGKDSATINVLVEKIGPRGGKSKKTEQHCMFCKLAATFNVLDQVEVVA